MSRERIGSEKFGNIWGDLEEGTKRVKKIAWDNNVSEGSVRNIQRDHPLFFGWRNTYNQDD